MSAQDNRRLMVEQDSAMPGILDGTHTIARPSKGPKEKLPAAEGRKKDEDEGKKNEKEPERTPLKQQKLSRWEPLLGENQFISGLMIFTGIFFGLWQVLNETVPRQEKRYDNIPGCLFDKSVDDPKYGQQCTFNMTIERDMEPPIYVYYQLEGVYQNHRQYATSYSLGQFTGEDLASVGEGLVLCDPINTYKGKTIYPCGLLANSFFNDRISATRLRPGTADLKFCGDKCDNNDMWSWQEEPNWSKEHIAWKQDIESKKFTFKEKYDKTKFTRQGPLQVEQTKIALAHSKHLYDNATFKVELPQTDDEELMVWMRISGRPKFQKLYRIIKKEKLKKGDTLVFTINNFFRVTSFGGKKSIVISKTSWLGGDNTQLGKLCMWLGIICAVVLVLVFLLVKAKYPPVTKLADLTKLNKKNNWANYMPHKIRELENLENYNE